MYLSGHSNILANEASLKHGQISSISGNANSLYMDEMFSAFNFSPDPIVNDFAQLFINCNILLC